MKKLYFLVFIIFFLQACQTLPNQEEIVKNFQNFSIPKSDPYPTDHQLKTNLRTIVIANVNTNELGTTSKAFLKGVGSDLNSIMKTTIEKHLSEIGARIYDVNDRQQKELVDASKRNEMLSTESASGQIELIDYVIIPKLASLDTSVLYNEKKSIYEIISRSEPSPKCIHEVKLSGTLRIYNGKTKQVDESIYIKASSTDIKEEPKNRICIMDNNVLNRLIQKVAEDAINFNKTKLMNAISPTAFIKQMKKRNDSKQYVVKITCGDKCGIRNNFNININKYQPLEIVGDSLGSGRVTYWIENDYAWVLLNNSKDLPQKIEEGAVVQIEYQKTMAEHLMSFYYYIKDCLNIFRRSNFY